MLDGSGVVAFKDALVKPQTITVAGVERLLRPKDWVLESRFQKREPEPLKLATLTGLCSYIKNRAEDFPIGDAMVVVDSWLSVSLVGKLESEEDGRGRPVYAIAQCRASEFKFGVFHEHEQFTIGLSAMFSKTDDRDAMLALLASISSGSVRESLDNGLTQRVVAQVGLTTKENVEVKQPWSLAPFRTFREVEQPTSDFLLRLREGDGRPFCALFEADGGVWREDSMARITAWLEKQTLGIPIVG